MKVLKFIGFIGLLVYAMVNHLFGLNFIGKMIFLSCVMCITLWSIYYQEKNKLTNSKSRFILLTIGVFCSISIFVLFFIIK